MIEQEHGIAPNAPRAVMEHEKGVRPSHFHVVYSIVDLATGRAIPSHDNFVRDELISRFLELEFGERIVPGPRLESNITELEQRGLQDEAERLRAHAPVRQEDGLSRQDRRQADRLGLKAPEWSIAAFELFEGCHRNLDVFAGKIEGSGFMVAQGDRAILLVDDKTGYHTSLVRLLRREAKAAGRPLDMSEQDVAAAFPTAPPFDQARDTGLERARAKAERDVEVERRTATYEAIADADTAELEAFRVSRRKAKEQDEAQERARFQATLKARREVIQALYRERDAVRRRRVDRAFRAARVFATPELRRLAFGLAAAGVLMTGGGLVMALAGGLYAAHLVPSRTRARILATAAQRDRTADATARRAALDDAYRRGRDEIKLRTERVRLSFDMIAKEDRFLAGFYADALLRAPGSLEASTGAGKAAADALGPEIAAGINRMLERGSHLQVRRVLHWYRGVAPSRRDEILAASLRRHAHGSQSAERAPASPVEPPLQRRPSTSATVPGPKRRVRDVGPER